jgi:hypothetical protein
VAKQVIISAFLVLGVLWLIWLAAPGPLAPTGPATLGETPWALPAPRPGDPRKSVAAITQRNLWGKVQSVAEEPQGEPRWRLVGVVRKDKHDFVLVGFDSAAAVPRPATPGAAPPKPRLRIESLGIGDELPGGAKILKIEQDRLCILISGVSRALPIRSQ